MSRTWITALALALAVSVPVGVLAHEGHVHKVLGTVASVQGNHVEVKSTDGKVVMIMLDEKTAITRGKTKVQADALKTGDRVSVDYMQDKTMNMAKAVKLAEAPVPAKK
jgi:hypothetical protein